MTFDYNTHQIFDRLIDFRDLQHKILDGKTQRYISQTKAYKEYGRLNVEFWRSLKKGKKMIVNPIKRGTGISSKILFDRLELEAAKNSTI